MGRLKKVKIVKKAVEKEASVVVSDEVKLAEERVVMLKTLRVTLDTEGITRMSGLDIKLGQAEAELNRLRQA